MTDFKSDHPLRVRYLYVKKHKYCRVSWRMSRGRCKTQGACADETSRQNIARLAAYPKSQFFLKKFDFWAAGMKKLLMLQDKYSLIDSAPTLEKWLYQYWDAGSVTKMWSLMANFCCIRQWSDKRSQFRENIINQCTKFCKRLKPGKQHLLV